MPSSRATASAPPRPDPVSWRDGVHVTGTAIWCDARRARDVCFVSCAHAVSASRHGQLIATAPTLALLSGADARHAPQSQLSTPYGRPFSLGTVRLELLPSGHALGGASLTVDVDGHRVLYAGPVDPRGGGLGGAAELRPCDTLVVAATYGDPGFSFSPAAEAAAQVAAFAAEIAAAGGVAVLLVSSPSKGLDVADRLAATVPVAAHRSIHHAARKLATSGTRVPTLARWTGRARGGGALLWPAGGRAALDRAALPAQSRVALVSGAAQDPTLRAALGADAAFAWSNQADHATLLAYIDASGAQRVFLTSRFAEPLAAALDSPRRAVKALGPPRQMHLFG